MNITEVTVFDYEKKHNIENVSGFRKPVFIALYSTNPLPADL